VTLLQMATMYAAIANGGKLWLPQLVERVESPDGKVLEDFAPRVRRELAVSPETLAIVRQALVGVVNQSKGTAFKARPKDIEVAGKTGTAQVRSGRAEGGYEFNTHAWFVGFAPAGRPRIALAVLVEHGGHGGDVAAPLAMDIVNAYFENAPPAEREAPRVGLLRRRLPRPPAAATPAAAPAAAPGAAPAEAPPPPEPAETPPTPAPPGETQP
jgi:penicillin-binding protein 2